MKPLPISLRDFSMTVSKKIKNKAQEAAVFLDRDGTLTKRRELTWKKSQLKLQTGIIGFLRFLNSKKIPVIVITNQPVVARGLISEEEVRKLHDFLEKKLELSGVHVDQFYFCPHHPQATLPGYRRKCLCRKPGTGMLKEAKKDFSIDFKKSYFVGDMTQDILAGKRVGVKTILLEKGYKGLDGKHEITPDYNAKNFGKVIRIFKKNGFI